MSKQVMQQALEALEECQYATTSKADKMVDVAMKALRAALAEPEPTGERAELIELLRVNAAQTLSYQHFKQCHQAADMLEADEKLQAAAQAGLDALLECQERIDGEWGSCRTNAQIEIDGETFPEITALKEVLK
jgi:hypothetical protein